jgi:hypothetical protein
MALDALLRILFYSTLVSGASYAGVKVWNAVIMPDPLRRPIAVFLWLQSGIYTMLMISLLCTVLGCGIGSWLVWVTTTLMGAQACTVIAVAARVSRFRRFASLILIPAGLLALMVLL